MAKPPAFPAEEKSAIVLTHDDSTHTGCERSTLNRPGIDGASAEPGAVHPLAPDAAPQLRC
jgi:hypothetical protein